MRAGRRRSLGPELRGTGTQNRCQLVLTAAGGGQNMEMSPGDPESVLCVRITVGGATSQI